jgi:hypothetical protein
MTTSLPPHPDPLPQGEGTAACAFWKFQRHPFRRQTDDNSPSPTGEGRGEGKLDVLLHSVSIWWLTFPFICLLAFAMASLHAATTNDLSDAEIQGRNLARQLCEAQPAENFTNTGVLQIRDGKGKTSKIPIKFETIVTTTNWSGIYELSPRDFVTNTPMPTKLVVLHDSSNSNQYHLTFYLGGDPKRQWTKDRSDVVVTFPFAGDFGVADLGLEFFHWPEQKILKHEMRRGRACKVLESTNPNLSSNNTIPPICYSRVVSWIDNESGGIVQAEAYDFKNKRLKEFAPKSFKKVNGQWELQEMEIRNVQTGSRTRLEFDLKKE